MTLDNKWRIRLSTQKPFSWLRNNRWAHCAWLPCVLVAGNFVQTATAEPTWHIATTEPYPAKRDDIVFVDRSVGFYGTGKGRLFRTDDGGQSWRLEWEHPGTFIRSLGFIDAKHGFLGNLGVGLGSVSDPVPLYRTADGGLTWQPVQFDGGAIAGICSIDIVKGGAIFEGNVHERVVVDAAGRANGPAQVLRSEDGGDTWTVIDLSDRAGMILDVKFIDPNTGFVFAGTNSDLSKSSALILKTSDGGRSWHEVYRSSRNQEIIWKASFPNARIAYATLQNDDDANAQQRLVKSVDGGNHWQEMPLVQDKEAREFAIGFVDENRGWVGTAIGGFETRNGGKDWTRVALAPKTNKIRTKAVDGTPMIYAIGTEVQFYDSSPN